MGSIDDNYSDIVSTLQNGQFFFNIYLSDVLHVYEIKAIKHSSSIMIIFLLLMQFSCSLTQLTSNLFNYSYTYTCNYNANYVWMQLIRTEYKFISFAFNVLCNSHSCRQAFGNKAKSLTSACQMLKVYLAVVAIYKTTI